MFPRVNVLALAASTTSSALASWVPRSTFGLVLATIYLVIAVSVLVMDRKESGGGWITLHGMATYVITLPISLLREMIGMKANYRSNVDMAFTIGSCVALVYWVAVGLASVGRWLSALFSR